MTTINPYSFLIDEMTFSFSRISTYNRCPRGFYLQYIKKVPQIQNAFAEYGLFCHELLEDYFNNELMIFDLLPKYKDEFTQQVIHDFPPNKWVDLAVSYFEEGIDYFTNFDGLHGYEILEVERKVEFNIDKYPFVGYIDLIAKDKNGDLCIIDHKSKDLKKPQKKRWKNVEVRRTIEFYEFIRQLYLYSIPIVEQDKVIPKFLCFNCFRKGKFHKVPFDMDDYEESKQWALNIIKKLYADETMSDKYDSQWFCNRLCGVREFCTGSDCYLGIEG